MGREGKRRSAVSLNPRLPRSSCRKRYDSPLSNQRAVLFLQAHQSREWSSAPRTVPIESNPSTPKRPHATRSSGSCGRGFTTGRGAAWILFWHRLQTGTGLPFALGSTRMREEGGGVEIVSLDEETELLSGFERTLAAGTPERMRHGILTGQKKCGIEAEASAGCANGEGYWVYLSYPRASKFRAGFQPECRM